MIIEVSLVMDQPFVLTTTLQAKVVTIVIYYINMTMPSCTLTP